MGQKSRYPLPIVPEPPETVCYIVRVPKDPFYIAAFRGAIYGLSKPYVWENDATHKALRAGARWLKVFQQLTIDPFCGEFPLFGGVEDGDQMLRVNPDNPCELQEFCGGNWVHFWGPTDCAALGGTLQPTSGGTLAPGACAEYDVQLRGNDRWLVPQAVSAGYVVTISNVQGAWSDGTLQWACPSGQAYALNICGTNLPSQAGDPLPAVNHMRLIAGIDATSPVYTDADGATIVVPSGVTDKEMWLQANDGTLSDNAGTISFHVTVCAAAPVTGSHVFDFTIDDRGWAAYGTTNATYSAGLGWDQGCDQPGSDTYSQVVIRKNAVRNSHITKVEVTFDRVYSGFNDGQSGGYAVKNFVPGGGGVAIGTDSSMATGSPIVDDFSANPVDMTAADYLVVGEVDGYLHNRGNCASLAGGSVRITRIEVFWTGADPF